MAEGSAIPNSLERWDLIVTRALVSFERISWIDADADGDDISRAGRRFETIGGDQLVVGIKRWCVAVPALFPCEQSLPAFGGRIEMVRIGGRTQRVEIEGQCIELGIAIAGRRKSQIPGAARTVSIG